MRVDRIAFITMNKKHVAVCDIFDSLSLSNCAICIHRYKCYTENEEVISLADYLDYWSRDNEGNGRKISGTV